MLYKGMSRFIKNQKEALLEGVHELVSPAQKRGESVVGEIHALLATKDPSAATTHNPAITGISQEASP